jgi:enoyl-CoA hydratase
MNDDFDFKNVALELGQICVLTINRPKAMNALNSDTMREIADALDAVLETDDAEALVITGAGDRAFVAGADIGEFGNLEDVFGGREMALNGQDVMSTVAAMPIPVIAAVNGFALGGGFELALACDLRVASRSAKFGLPEVGLGLIPGFGGTQRLPRLIGEGRALDLILTGRHVEADEALMLGLVNRVGDDALEEAKKLASVIIKNGPVALGLAKEAVRRGLDVTLAEGLEIEADLFGMVSTTKDMREGTSAFLEKRKPNFKGE